MHYRKTVPFIFILAILLAACQQARPTIDAMQQDKPARATAAQVDTPQATAGAMMDDASKEMKDTVTPSAMMEESGQMMDTATPGAKMEDQSKAMMETATPDAMMGEAGSMMETATPDMGAESMMAPAWFSITLTDVATQESFTINDLKGKVVLVEAMAQWCPTCLQQQKQVQELLKHLGDTPDIVSVGLDIDPNEDSASLTAYIEKNGFTWQYAVSPAEMSREIGNLYGSQFLNPPSAPMLIIDRHGEVHPLPFGIKSAADLLKALEPYLMAGQSRSVC
jgi:thiol-disulfide isomerase/thioredoxin